MRCLVTALVAALLISAGDASLVCAQVGALGGISGSGTVLVKRRPEIMRMQVVLSGSGKTIQDALAKLKTVRESAVKRLEELGADKSSIKVDPPTAGVTQQQQNLEMMMRQQLAARGRAVASNDGAPKSVDVSAALTADWQLKDESAEERLVRVHELQEKVRGADLAKAKDATHRSLEEQEKDEETAALMASYQSDNGPKPGEPTFLFVSKISEQDRDQAVAEAFQKATTEAARLSKAAGIKRGKLRSLHAGETDIDYDANMYAGGSQAYVYQMLQQQRAKGKTSTNEAVGADPAEVKVTITVTASFDFGS